MAFEKGAFELENGEITITADSEVVATVDRGFEAAGLQFVPKEATEAQVNVANEVTPEVEVSQAKQADRAPEKVTTEPVIADREAEAAAGAEQQQDTTIKQEAAKAAKQLADQETERKEVDRDNPINRKITSVPAGFTFDSNGRSA